MSREDPKAYREFVNKQLQEGADMMKTDKSKPPPPEPCFCVRFNSSTDGVAYFLNFCSSPTVEPMKPDQEVPMYVSSTIRCQLDVVVNPSVFERCSTDTVFKSDLISLVRETLVTERSLVLDRFTFSSEPVRPLVLLNEKNPSAAPSPLDALAHLRSVTGSNQAPASACVHPNAIATLAAEARIITQEALAAPAVPAGDVCGVSGAGESESQPAKVIPGGAVRPVVVEVPTVTHATRIVPGLGDRPAVRELVVSIVAPSCVESARDLDLRYDEGRLFLTVEKAGIFDFEVALPESVAPDADPKCKFVRASGIVRIMLPLRNYPCQ